MTTILIVDDSAVDRRLAGSLVEKIPGMKAAFATDGEQALTLIAQNPPELVLTDLQMEGMDGLELVRSVRQSYPTIPVVLMTAHGSEEIAVRALRAGAASYVPKHDLTSDLASTLEPLLSTIRRQRQEERVMECWTQSESHYYIENDLGLIPPLISHLQDRVARIKLCDETGLIRIAVALHEALVNAIVHGNLEIGSKQSDESDEWYEQELKERQEDDRYRDRRVHLIAEENRSEVAYVIQDEGNGFDPAQLPDPTDPANLERLGGRGLLLIRTFMDEVSFNESGNQITMVKRKDR